MVSHLDSQAGCAPLSLQVNLFKCGKEILKQFAHFFSILGAKKKHPFLHHHLKQTLPFIHSSTLIGFLYYRQIRGVMLKTAAADGRKEQVVWCQLPFRLCRKAVRVWFHQQETRVHLQCIKLLPTLLSCWKLQT